MLGAATLRQNTFEEVEADGSATRQATWVVVIMALATGLGFFGPPEDVTVSRWYGLYFGILFGLGSWGSFLALAWGAPHFLAGGDQLHELEWGKLVRSTGYAQSPGVLKVLGLVSGASPWVFGVFGVVTLWQLVATVISVRQPLWDGPMWQVRLLLFVYSFASYIFGFIIVVIVSTVLPIFDSG